MPTSDHPQAIPGWQVTLMRWDHSASGSRVIRCTWEARVASIGTPATSCGHYGHKSEAAAEKCGWSVARQRASL